MQRASPHRTIALTGAIVLSLARLLVAQPPATGSLRLVDPEKTTQGAPQRLGNCMAVLPTGWQIVASGSRRRLQIVVETGSSDSYISRHRCAPPFDRSATQIV